MWTLLKKFKAWIISGFVAVGLLAVVFAAPLSPPETIVQPEITPVLIPLKSEWTDNSRKYQRGNRFIIDVGIATQNYKDDTDTWQEIDLTPVVSDLPQYDLMIDKTPYKAYFAFDGARRIYPDRNDDTKYIEFPATKFLSGKTFVQNGNRLEWKSETMNIIHRWENSRIAFDVILKKAPILFNRLESDVIKVGISDEEFLQYMSGLRVFDSSDRSISRTIAVSLVGSSVVMNFDTSGMKFPITVDPTIDLQVGTDTDDLRDTENFGTQGSIFGFGNTQFGTGFVDSGARFLNVTVPKGSTIDVAHLTLTVANNQTSLDLVSDIFGEDADDPVTFSDQGNFRGRTRTSATVAFDLVDTDYNDNEEVNLTDMAAIVQEIIDRSGWSSGNAMVFFVEDDGSAAAAASSFSSDQHDDDNAGAPKLHIEYTAAGAAPGSPSMFIKGNLFIKGNVFIK